MTILDKYADIVEAQDSHIHARELFGELFVALRIAAQAEPALKRESWVWALMYGQTPPLEFFRQTIEVPRSNDPSGDPYERIFFLLLAGNAAQAASECAAAKDWPLKSAIESDGIELVKRTCLLVARGTEMRGFQRGVYGLLSGDLETSVAVCPSWESACVARLMCGAQEHAQGPSQTLFSTPAPIYSTLEAILNNTLESYLQDQAKSWLDESTQEDLDLLRVNAHLAIATGAAHTDALIHAYIETLVASGLILKTPAYVRFLSRALQPDVYASVLLRVDGDVPNDAHRALQVALSRRYGLDIASAALQAVRIRLADYLEQPRAPQPLVALGDLPAPGDDEMAAVSALQWLETVDNYDALVRHSVELLRAWLCGGRLPAVLFAGRWLPLASAVNLCVDPALSDECDELQQHLLLIEFFRLVQETPSEALARLLPFEQYLAHPPAGLASSTALTSLRQYIPYGAIELVRALDGPEQAMQVAVRVASVPRVTALFEPPRLNQLVDLLATRQKNAT